MSKTIGVFYQVYKNNKATEFVLKNFRKHFSTNKVVLISDGGNDFTDLADKYNCKYYYQDNIFSNFKKNGRSKKSYIYSKDIVLKWYERQKLVCDITKSDYIMILEDDVYVRDSFTIEEDFDLKGVDGPRLSKNMIFNGNERYGMCGGSVYNAKIFLEIYNDIVNDITNNHDKLYHKQGYETLGAVDANITYHFCKRGYTYSIAPWLIEQSDDVDNKDSYPLLHEYKENY